MSENDNAGATIPELEGLLKAFNNSRSSIESEITAITASKEDFGRLKAKLEKQAQDLEASAAEIQSKVDNTVSAQQEKLNKISEDLRAFEENLKQQNQSYNNLKTVVDQELASFRTRVETEQATLRQNLEKISTDFQNTFTKTQEQHSKDFTQAQDERGKEFNLKVREFDTTFTQAQTQREKEFSAAELEHEKQHIQKTKDLDDKINSEIVLLKAKMDSEFSGLSTRAATIIDVLTEFQAQAKQVVGVVINTAQAGVYKTYADEEKLIANFFRRNATMCLILAILVLIGPELKIILWDQGIGNASINWNDFYTNLWHRALVSFVLLAPTIYFSKESAKHRNNEFRNRKLENILLTVDPYLALLGPEKKSELKAELARNIFNPNARDIDRSGNDDFAGWLTKFTKAIRG